ncbi:MAG: tetrahydromethanopterin S-methyltransferase subunit MtrB [Methanobacteriaceae archaeon]
MEMLPLVRIVPEYNLTLDPSTGIVGAALGNDVIIHSLDNINEEIAKMEIAAEDLMTSLDPTAISQEDYPGREGAYLTAGLLTNMVYGFLIGLLIMIAVLLF